MSKLTSRLGLTPRSHGKNTKKSGKCYDNRIDFITFALL